MRQTAEIGTIDHEMTQVAQAEDYWRSVLKRLVSVLLFLCERGLAIRGDDQIIGSVHNGNYLDVLSEYDDYLKQHIQKHTNRRRGHTSYLSSTICDELIQLMGKKVLDEIILYLKKSKYYSISIDSTPDEGHVDQLNVIFRFMELREAVECFATFMPNQGHKVLNETLKSNRSSVLIPKRVTTTRWSYRTDASKALQQGYSSFKEALKIENDKDEKDVIRYEAKGLYDQMCQLEMGIYAMFWNEVLDRVNTTSHILQDPKADLHIAVSALTSWQKPIEDKCDLFSEYEAK
ncbi:uncharacterized protein [Palaemon carinicauda]|uniref:uncharacterized protein n=1 Tax=Palaemon carinicauda TaxID=392227 RepID=UPI0035B5B261